jgi:beta-fructofuranosidase
MKETFKFFCLLVGVFFLLPPFAHGQYTNPAVLTATVAMEAAAPRAQADPWHPVFHVASPAQWMNDPNGPVFYKGYYHLFYQLTPFSDQGGIRYWGHFRSRDLVKWEQLPVALWPSGELGEESVWSGCCVINDDGHPIAFYTSIGQGKSPFNQAVQWAAIGDDNLITWQKFPGNPVLSDRDNDGLKIYDWRDPFVFRDGTNTFLVTGGHMARNGDAAVNIYQAANSAFTQWKRRGVLYHIPGAPTAECPNFFKVGNQYVLVVSPYGAVQYFVGDFDGATCQFHPRTSGVLDDSSSFYAPNTMQLPDGRRLLWGWVKDFPAGHGWNGCLSLPRELSLSSGGDLLQSPAPQLAKLRGRGITWRDVRLENNEHTFSLPKTNTLEIQMEVDWQAAKNLRLKIEDDASNASPVEVHYDGSQLRVLDSSAQLKLKPGEKLRLDIFMDRSVLEIFANDRACFTKVIPPFGGNLHLAVSADSVVTMPRLQAWPMKSIW